MERYNIPKSLISIWGVKMEKHEKTLEAVHLIVSSINERLVGQTGPLVVCLDGGSGAGKT
jgi:hypothetical protein